jgi:hypothetical protein
MEILRVITVHVLNTFYPYFSPFSVAVAAEFRIKSEAPLSLFPFSFFEISSLTIVAFLTLSLSVILRKS